MSITFTKSDPLSSEFSLFSTNLSLRKLLKDTKGFTLYGPHSDLLTDLRSQIIEHDQIIIEPLSTSKRKVYIPRGHHSFNLPPIEYMFLVKRPVYILKSTGEDSIFTEEETTFGEQEYLAIYSTTGNVAYLKMNSIMLVGEELDMEFLKSLVK